MQLPIHRKLVTASVLTLLVSLAVWYLLIFPLHKTNVDNLERQQRTTSDLRSKGYPTDPDKLRTMRRSLQEQKAKLQKDLGAVYDKSMGQYGDRLKVYDSVLGFRRAIGQLDYQVVFNRIQRQLSEQDINLHEPVLGLSENSTSDKTYQLVAHMWTVHDVAILCKKHNLNLKDYGYTYTEAQKQAMGGRPTPPARIKVGTIKTYLLDSSADTLGYLEEYPVTVTVDGNLQDVTNFLTDLTSQANFLPLESTAIRKIGANNLRMDRVEATIQCSSFLILHDKQNFQPKVEADLYPRTPPRRGM